MLRQLHISNLAIIENVDIELSGGLNVFTGETGAGKSLIMGSLELLLGLRGGGEEAATFVRPGCSEARVSGVFDIVRPATVARLGEILDQSLGADGPLIITRRLMSSGRSSATVNGCPVTVAMLRQAGELLVDIHGQHDQQFLLKPANQLAILDAYAEAEDVRTEFAQTLRKLRESQRRLEEMRDSDARRGEMLELYRFQADEIDAAELAPGEYAQVKARYGVLKNITHLKARSSAVLEGLCDGEGSVEDKLGSVSHSLQELTRVDGKLAELSAQVQLARETLQDAAKALSRYQDSLDVDAGELDQVEQRLDLLNKLIHKYARGVGGEGDPVTAVLEHRKELARKIAQLDVDSQALAGLEGQIGELSRRLVTVGRKLTQMRTAAAARLKPLIQEQFRELEMPEAAFDVSLQSRPAVDAAIDGSGLDEVEFLVRTNPGQQSLPLRKIASGGEISRIMLAIKTILADKDQVCVLVFDEIDANIGDRLGAAIGRKMRMLANGHRPGRRSEGQHQILCITHLSQIAACADRHLQISKSVTSSGKQRRTSAQVKVLEGEHRVGELAQMMAGKNISPATLEHARNLLGGHALPTS